ncbi:unnamed protein product [Acanthoscelides obtectus]|uniref:Uncharacterized protein n=1 Tax=Acanthoscelides obtectus TaxID=200917 RepID=A0A9P0Q100_ACAOB|nr:unnamed protein product [Acanthoscelides obtectus]CAK1624186.1 hypothetical protein AOBTE_LOCUS2382 [Acanthoscelides obtectus]
MVRQKCFLCKVEAGKAGIKGISFLRLPANEKQREKWITFLELTELEPQSHKDVSMWKIGHHQVLLTLGVPNLKQ